MRARLFVGLLIGLLLGATGLARASIIPGNARGLSSDPLALYQWALKNEGQTLVEDLNDIRSERVQGRAGIDIGIASIYERLPILMKRDILVAILDTGVDLEHEELSGAILRNEIECDQGKLPFQPKEDRDGNGLKGDCMGWNFTADDGGNNRPYDDVGHGTHLAGIIAAQNSNSLGIAGTAPRIKILPVKVLKKQENAAGAKAGLSFTDRIALGVRYAVRMKADVINLSLGWPKALDTDNVRKAVREAIDAGVTVVAAAGNNSSDRSIFPCSYRDVICVGSVSADGSYSAFSNQGGAIDLLAPGNQILSTFPKKLTPDLFSIQGYEIKSGTSQAAPFVSAAVAILKSSLGPISLNEIRSRLRLSSLSLPLGKTITAGLLQIDAALGMSAAPSVFPVFKELQIVSYQADAQSGGTFEIALPIRNDWTDARSIQIDLEAGNSAVGLDQTHFTITSLGQNEERILLIRGRITDLNARSDLPLSLRISHSGRSRAYFHAFSLSRSLNSDRETIRSPIELLPGMDSGLISQLRSVTDRYRESSYPEYFVSTPGTQQKPGMSVYLFRRESDGQYRARTLVLPQATQLLSVIRVDLNYDGQADYLVRSLATDGKDRFLSYSYLGTDFSPLFRLPSGDSNLKFTPEVAITDLRSLGFFPFTTPHGVLAMPSFVAQGTVPAADKNPDPWFEDDRAPRKHIYFYEPDFKTGTLTTRIVDSSAFIEARRSELGLEWPASFNIVEVEAQDGAQFRAGRSSFVVSVGREVARRYFLITLSKDRSVTVVPMNDPGFRLDGSLVRFNVELPSRYFAGNTYFGMQSELLISFRIRDRIHHYRHSRAADHLFGALASFTRGNEDFAFLETKSQIVLFRSNGTSESSFTHPIHRSSFIPGNVFSELYYPIIAGGDASESRPALYIDATQIQSGNVYVVSAETDGLRSRVGNNILVPENCISLNPVRFGDSEAFSLLCRSSSDKSAMLEHLPIR